MTEDIERLIQAVRRAHAVASSAAYVADVSEREARRCERQSFDAMHKLQNVQKDLVEALSADTPYVYNRETGEWTARVDAMVTDT